MQASCPSCGHAGVTCVGDIAPGYQFAGRLLDAPLPGGRLYACPACFLSFRWPLPSREALDALYQQAHPDHWQYAPEQRPDWQITWDWMHAHLRGGSVLDVGCFDGAFLDALGPEWTRYGVELNEAALRRAEQRAIRIVARDVDDLASLAQQFDVVTAFNVIEHVADCRLLLRRMADRVRPGGVVAVASGNTQAPSWQLMGSRYWYCTIPEHLAFISEAWCEKAAADLNLQLAHLARYSVDAHRAPWRIAYERGVNGLFRFFPRVFAMLRALGLGEVDAKTHPALRSYPPMWTTAKDHLVAIFRKP
jgi:2-polyprenyl-3-methyl-5-hydroxy-6-metoxy-1,4-benzoquinol methylase